MKNKRTINILIFTLAIIALLLRPFFFYQLTESQNLIKDPVAANTLLQRLIKKKDDHHSLNIAEFSAILCTDRKSPPPVLFPILQKSANELPSLAFVYHSGQFSTIFKIFPVPKYYRLLSKFQI